ncbi:phage antirepressor [Apilactobacillus xinyiensis]|uniref:phage antirepressor n=1 Tax=Apilactobacillus xinyiensis TaxID=2841032 RepID=UPI001C7CA7A5|nr:phage antirepressor KilAC domain-containing protein [Apilactobacillus xinyiensis]
MMNAVKEVTPINNFDFNGSDIFTIEIDNKVWFWGKQVAKLLNYRQPNKAVNDHIKLKHRKTLTQSACSNLGSTEILWSGYDHSAKTLIDISGIYSLVLRSTLPQAEDFQDWVTDEVLPSIQKTGSYNGRTKQPSNVIELLQDPDNLLQLVTNYKDAKDEVKRLKPKALIADAIEVNEKSILVRQMAKIISNNLVNIGEKRLFEWLRENGYLIKRQGSDYNMPTQKSINLKIFQVKSRTVPHNSGYIEIKYTPKITGKGQRYLLEKFMQMKINQIPIQLPGNLDLEE